MHPAPAALPFFVPAGRRLRVAGRDGQVQQMVEEAGNPDGFSASAWFSSWIAEPLPALGGSRPIEFLDTMEGQGANLLMQMRVGVYA